MTKLTRRTMLAGLSAAAALRPDRAFAAWPERSITLVHGLAPGGGVDVTARLIADGLSRRLGQQIVVEPKPGAAATLGAAHVARATPDGYTFFFVSGSHSVTAAMYKSLPYHPIDDFSIVGQATDVPFMLVTYAGHPIRTVPDLIRIAKASPNPLLCGIPGVGSSHHLLMEHFSRLAGVKIQLVPFRGGNLALNELLGKRLDFLVDPPIALLGQIRGGQLQAIGVTSDTRFPTLPEVATIAEAGFPGFSVTSWMGVIGPANLPAPVVERLNREISQLVAEPATAERIRALGSEPKSGTPAQFKERMAGDLTRWTKVVADAGIEKI
jgi:tripartite-type tricarboxylate transporter receptor subunit TctC